MVVLRNAPALRARACRVILGHHPSTQRLLGAPCRAEEHKLPRLRAIARAHPSWGWKTAYFIAPGGLTVNRKARAAPVA